MAINITTIQTAYEAWAAKLVEVTTARGVVTALGERPAFPILVDDNADYNNVLTAQGTWDASFTAAQTTLTTKISEARALELTLLAALPPEQWIKLTKTGMGAYTIYIGEDSTNNKVKTSAILPDDYFPNV